MGRRRTPAAAAARPASHVRRLLLLPLLLMLLLVTSTVPASAQQLTPFQGRGRPPAGGADVYVSAVVDHMISIDDASYKFEVVLYMLLTWQDPRAEPAMLAATEAAIGNASYNNGNGCAFPCTTIYAWTADPDGNNFCCDDLWLPHFEIINVRGLSQDRVVRYGIRFGENSSVAWWSHVQAELYTPLQFHSFPFDKQYLSVQLQYGNKFKDDPVRIIPSATGTQLYNPKAGDEISGWSVTAVHFRTFNLSEEDYLREVSAASTDSAPGDPWPLVPPGRLRPGFGGYLWQHGVTIFIEVDRLSTNSIITAILPIVINTLLSLLVFSVSPRHLDTRLGIVVTLFLSLTALQFVLASGLPSSATIMPTQQLIIVSYCILALIAVASICVFWIVSLHRTAERNRRLKRAQRQFSSRWTSLTSTMGFASAAAIVMQRNRASSAGGPQQRGKAKASRAGGSARADSAAGSEGRQVSFADEATGLGPGGLRKRSPSQQQQHEPPSPPPPQQEQPVQPQQAGEGGRAAAGPSATRALPASPFASAAAASGEPGGRTAQQQPGCGGGEPSNSGGEASQLPDLPLEPAASEVAARRHLLGLSPHAEQSGPHIGGMGIYTGSSDSSMRSGDEGGSSDESSEASMKAEPAPMAAAAQLGAGLDVEEEGGGPQQTRKWARWRRRALCCFKPHAAAAGGQPGAGAAPSKPNCFKLLWLKMRLMKEEMQEKQDYAMYVAMEVDRRIFWTTLCGFIISVILIFAIQAQEQPTPF